MKHPTVDKKKNSHNFFENASIEHKHENFCHWLLCLLINKLIVCYTIFCCKRPINWSVFLLSTYMKIKLFINSNKYIDSKSTVTMYFSESSLKYWKVKKNFVTYLFKKKTLKAIEQPLDKHFAENPKFSHGN